MPGGASNLQLRDNVARWCYLSMLPNLCGLLNKAPETTHYKDLVMISLIKKNDKARQVSFAVVLLLIMAVLTFISIILKPLQVSQFPVSKINAHKLISAGYQDKFHYYCHAEEGEELL
ncbi:unnamed protein product [Sphagnum balticum]